MICDRPFASFMVLPPARERLASLRRYCFGVWLEEPDPAPESEPEPAAGALLGDEPVGAPMPELPLPVVPLGLVEEPLPIVPLEPVEDEPDDDPLVDGGLLGAVGLVDEPPVALGAASPTTRLRSYLSYSPDLYSA